MSFTQEMSMGPRFGLEISPALISFAELLMLPLTAMQSLVEEELSCNDALERLEVEAECPVCRGAWRTRCPVCSATSGGPGTSDTTRHTAEFSELAAGESDTEGLLHAVRLETSAADAVIVDYLVESLDDHGLMDRSCHQLATELGVDEATVARVLAIIRRTGAPGVGATSITECLLLQVEALHLENGQTALAGAVIREHLPALAKGHFASIAAALGVTVDEIREVLDLIRARLRPYPAFNGTAQPVGCYVVPDLVVRPHDEISGEFMVDLVEPVLTRLGVRRLARRRQSGASVSQARSFVAQLSDRWETLRRVGECAVAHQREFLRYGAASLKPLTRAEVSLELGLHESTVSRAVSDKYVLLPDRTIVPLARFFGASGGVDGELRRLLESAQGPVSDQRLAQLLCDAGYPIARRTVAKHRARLGIAPALLR